MNQRFFDTESECKSYLANIGFKPRAKFKHNYSSDSTIARIEYDRVSGLWFVMMYSTH